MRHILGVLAAVSLVSCGSNHSSNGDAKPRPQNTLAPADFHAKAASGDEIFKDLKALPSTFGAGKSEMLSGNAFAIAPQQPGSGKIDVNGGTCEKSGNATIVTIDFNTTTYQNYACKEPYAGRIVPCTVKIGTDQNGNEAAREQKCELAGSDPAPTKPTDTKGSAQEQGAASYLPRADAVTDCASAFDLFQSLFGQAQADYDNLTAELKNAAAQGKNSFGLTAATPAVDESVAYELSAKDTAGMTVAGRISGGGTDSSLTLRETVDMTIDFSKMTTGSTPGMPDMPNMPNMPAADLGVQKISTNNAVQLDLAARKVASSIDFKMTETQGGKTQTQGVHGSIEVSDGADKYVHQALTLALGDDPNQVVTTDMTARLVDANTLTITGTFAGAGKPGTVNYTVTKNAAGVCALAK